MTERFGAPLRRHHQLRFRSACCQDEQLLSCGSPEPRRRPVTVGPYGLGPPPTPLRLSEQESAMRSFGRRSGRGRASTTTTSLPALRRHYRVCPQRLVVGSRAVPADRWRHARGKSASEERGRLRIWCHPSASEEALGRGPKSGPERAPDRRSGWPDRPSGCRERSLWSPKRPRAHLAARGRRGLRASSRGLRRPGAEASGRRVSR
jgi:hypothetical protein